MSSPFVALGPLPNPVQVFDQVLEAARRAPRQEAVVERSGPLRRSITFGELVERTARLASGLLREGLTPGARVAVFVPPGIEFIVLTWALLRLGAVPVLADPGMGRKRLLAAIERTKPVALIGVRRALLAKALFPRAFSSVRKTFSVGPRLPFRARPLAAVEAKGSAEHEPLRGAPDTPAAILFTSGSTGPPKGVLYTHAMLDAEVRALRLALGFQAGERDLCGLPAFAMFDAALGLTSVFPPVDPSRPACADPEKIHAIAEEEATTTGFLSPALWEKLVPWMEQTGARFRHLARATSAGAPLQVAIVERLLELLPEGSTVLTPYGATEGLPIAVIGGQEIVSLRREIEAGAGTPLGRPAPGIELALAPISDGRLASFGIEQSLPLGQVGEVLVRGPVVTQVYDGLQEATALAKVSHPAGPPHWHRMGDLGRLDGQGRLWFLGRKAERIETAGGLVTPIDVENVFLTHPGVARCALVGVGLRGQELPVLVVEPRGPLPKGEHETQAFITSLRQVARRSPRSADIRTFLFHEALPTDARHNSKIRREDLKLWAQQALEARR